MILLRLFVGLFLTGALGFVIIGLTGAERKLSRLESAALSYLIGQGTLTLFLFFLFLLPIAHRTVVAASLIAVMFVLRLFFVRGKRAFSFEFLKRLDLKKSGLYFFIFTILVTGLFVKLSYAFVDALSKPEYSWDASGNWTVAGRNYYFLEQLEPDKLSAELANTVNGYPRAISIMHYWLFNWLGEANDQWSKIIFPVELLCLLIVIYYSLRQIRGDPGALAGTYLLFSAPLFLYHATIGYMDLSLTVYFSVGIIYLYRWALSGENSFFWLFSLPLAYTAWLKLEGKTLYAIGLVLLLVYLWRDFRGAAKSKLMYAAGYLALFLLIGLPWQLFIVFNHLPNAQTISPNLPKFFEFHRNMYESMFLQGSWGLFWLLGAAVMIFFFRRQLSGKNLYLFFALLLFYGDLLFVYLGFHSSVSEMAATFNRVLLPIYPIAVFNLACVLPPIKIGRDVNL